jgi:hypothetical protein
MASGLKRFHQSGQFHFITFSCYRRKKKLNSPASRTIFEQALERVRRQYAFYICGYVVMPEHVASSRERTGEKRAFIDGHSVAEARRVTAVGIAGFRTILAWSLLWFQCVERDEADREVAVHAPESREERVGGEARGLGVEQLPALFHGGTWNRRDWIGVDGEVAGAKGDQASTQG